MTVLFSTLVSSKPDKIREIGGRIEEESGTMLAGGGRLQETLLPTAGGFKNARRPDVLYRDKDGVIKAINVGRTKADGSPVKCEVQALQDLNNSGVPTVFESYDE